MTMTVDLSAGERGRLAVVEGPSPRFPPAYGDGRPLPSIYTVLRQRGSI